MEGDNFQDFCDRLCLKLYPNDYTPVRSGGKEGDTKNDGYCPNTHTFFQAHATRGEQLSKTKAKIENNIKGCIDHYQGIKCWIYLTNDTLVGSVHKFVDGLRPKYPNVRIELWDHKKIADKISGLSEEEVNYILDINLFGDNKALNEIKDLLMDKKKGEKDLAASLEQDQLKNIKTGYSGQEPQSQINKSADYKRVLSLYNSKPTKESVTEVKKIVYSSDDPDAILQAIFTLVSWYKYSPDTVEDQNTLIDIGIDTAINLKGLDAEAILWAEKASNITTQFCLLDLEGWGKVEMTNRTGWPVITPQEQDEIVQRLKLLDLQSKELFKAAIDKAMESRNYLAISRVFSMMGSAAGQKADHFAKLGVKHRAEFEKKVCKSAFMYSKSVLIGVGDKVELAYLMHNFANAIRNFGEKEEALDLVDKSIKIAKENKIENFMDRAELLKHRILHPLTEE